MLKEVVFTSQAKAEALSARRNWAVISITAPGEPEASLQEGWHSVIRLQFDDVDVSESSEFKLFDAADAANIVSFVSVVKNQVEGILVHCYAGISRSAAIAKFIAEENAVYFPDKYGIYNKAIYRVLNATRWM